MGYRLWKGDLDLSLTCRFCYKLSLGAVFKLYVIVYSTGIIILIWPFQISHHFDVLSCNFSDLLKFSTSVSSLPQIERFSVSPPTSFVLLSWIFDDPFCSWWFTSPKESTQAPFCSNFSLGHKLATNSESFSWDYDCVPLKRASPSLLRIWCSEMKDLSKTILVWTVVLQVLLEYSRSP